VLLPISKVPFVISFVVYNQFLNVNFLQNSSLGNWPLQMLICGKVAKPATAKDFGKYTK